MSDIPIAFDESGNTGADLLNTDQSVFVLASVCYTEANQLLDLVFTPQSREAKFKRLKKSRAGERRVISFLQSEFVTAERVKINVFHKRYMVVTKIVDILIETIAHRDGIDLLAHFGLRQK